MARLLFFTPVFPGLTGQGTAIRAGIALEILAEKYEVTVVHAGHWSGSAENAAESWLRKHAADYHFLPAPIAPEAVKELASRALSQTVFDAAYVFRLAAAPLALQVLGMLSNGKISKVLDLDDDECTRAEKFIALREATGDFERAARERNELERQRRVQRMLLSCFDTSLLASPEDRDSLAARYPDRNFVCLPNVVRARARRESASVSASALTSSSTKSGHASQTAAGIGGQSPAATLLFLGTLDYLPNEDAVLYFCNSILPLIRMSDEQISLRVVGIQVPDSIRRLSALPGVRIVGPVKDVAPEYERASVMVVPLRAGSGTRIKILEAFSFGVPVVSTAIGAAGLDVTHEAQLLIADTPEEFSAACLRLVDDERLVETLAENAHQWLVNHHSLDQAREVLQDVFAVH